MLSILLGLRPDAKDLERIGVVFKQFDEDSNKGSIDYYKILKMAQINSDDFFLKERKYEDLIS